MLVSGIIPIPILASACDAFLIWQWVTGLALFGNLAYDCLCTDMLMLGIISGLRDGALVAFHHVWGAGQDSELAL